MSEHPFVGRERELGRLEAFLGRALAGHGQVAFVSGEAGSGKTVLVEEFARRAQGGDRQLRVAFGNCNAQSGAGDPYLPFREVLGVLTGIAERDAFEDRSAGRLQHWLVRSTQVLIEVGPDLVGSILPGGVLVAKAGKALAQKAGWTDELEKLARRKQGPAAPVQPEHLMEQYANVLKALSSDTPLLVVVDDLHWADEASINLLFHLSRRLESSSALLLGTYRPDELYARGEQKHPLEKVLAEVKRYAGDVWVDLRGAGEAEGREFVNRFLDTEPNRLDTAFREALFRRTEGHPLFTVELLRAMQERGDLGRDATGCWVAGPGLDFDTLPSRVEGVIEQRIGRLGEPLQELLRVASVEGEAFTAEVVAQVQGLKPRAVLGELSQDLERRHQLVQERGEVRAGQLRLSGYRFAHALFQHYLYGDLGGGERRILHDEVAQALEELYAEAPDPVLLAWHYDQAGDDPKAVAHYLKAGEQALRQGAPQEAQRLLSRGLELTPESDAAGRFELLLAREKALSLEGKSELQSRDVAALEHLADVLSDDGKRCEAALRKARYARRINDFPTAIAAAERVVASAVAANREDYQAEGYLAWGHALRLYGGQLEAAKARMEQALYLCGDRFEGVRADTLMGLGLVVSYSDYPQATAFYQQALALYRQIGDLRGENTAIRNLGGNAVNLGDDDRAATFLEEGRAGARRLGDRRGEAYANYVLGVLADNQGRYTQAKELLQSALEVYRQIGERMFEADILSVLGSIRPCQGEFAEARQLLLSALDIYQSLGNLLKSSTALRYLGVLERLLGNIPQARTHLGAALEFARGTQATTYEREALSNLAEVELCEGNPAKALELALLSNKGEHSEPERARFAEASALLALDRLEEAEAVFNGLLRARGNRAWVRLNAETGLAETALAKGNLGGALALVEGILPRLGQSDILKDVLSAYLTCYEVLQACGDPRAGEVLEQGYQMLQRQAAQLDEPARKMFLENVPSRRRLVAAWEAAQNAR